MRKSLKEAVKIEPGEETTKLECKLCEKGTPHLLCVMGKDGVIHVHAPFDNRYLMTQMVDAIIMEQRKFKG